MSHALVFRDDMTEVTGFGGEYERRVRAAIELGAELLRDYGVRDLSELQKDIGSYEVMQTNGRMMTMGKLLTRTQMGLVMYHLQFIAEYGWDAYCERMSKPENVTEGAA